MLELNKPPYLLFPWTPNAKGVLAESAMARVWERLKADELYATVFHENPELTFAYFMGFFTRDNVAAQICVDISEENAPAIAGMVWLSDFEQLASHRRATGSFVFFRGYQTPAWTDAFAKMALDFWFSPAIEGGLDCDLIVGMTPRPNRAARLFSVRNGFKYEDVVLKGYTCFNGRRCDAMLAQLSREDYRAQQQARSEEVKLG